MAARAGCRPAVPTMAISTMSAAGRVARFDQALRAADRPGRARQRRLAAPWPLRVADGDGFGLDSAAFARAAAATLLPAAKADHAKAVGQIVNDFQRAGADRAGAAEENEFFIRGRQAMSQRSEHAANKGTSGEH